MYKREGSSPANIKGGTVVDRRSSVYITGTPNKRRSKLQVFQDDTKLWCCGGRLDNANLPYDVKHSILLPEKHYFTTLSIWKSHEHVFNNDINLTEIHA